MTDHVSPHVLFQISYLPATGGDDSIYEFDLLPPSEGEEKAAEIDPKTKTVTAVREGETTLIVKEKLV